MACALLSFNNLVEAHVLRALPTKHGTSITAIRSALDFAQKELGIERLLLSAAQMATRARWSQQITTENARRAGRQRWAAAQQAARLDPLR